jgi:PST family polysaccharide transporter
VVRVLFGARWTAAVPFMRLLSIAAFAGSFSQVSEWIYLSQGTAHRLLRWSLAFRTPAVLAAVLVGLAGGPLGVATAVAAVTVLLAVPAVGYCVRGTSLTLNDVLRAAARPAFASLAAAAIVLSIGGVLPEVPGFPRLGAALAVYAVAFAGAWLGIPGGPAASRELLAALREFRPAGKL